LADFIHLHTFFSVLRTSSTPTTASGSPVPLTRYSLRRNERVTGIFTYNSHQHDSGGGCKKCPLAYHCSPLSLNFSLSLSLFLSLFFLTSHVSFLGEPADGPYGSVLDTKALHVDLYIVCVTLCDFFTKIFISPLSFRLLFGFLLLLSMWIRYVDQSCSIAPFHARFHFISYFS